MKNTHLPKALNIQFKQYEKLLNKEYSKKANLEKQVEESLITNYVLHDLATPLSSLQATFILLEESPKYTTKKEVLKSGKASVESAVEMLSTIKRFKKSREVKKVFNLSETIENVVRILHSKACKLQVSIIFCKSSDYYIKSYPLTLERVLMNIVNNAIEELSLTNKQTKSIQIDMYIENELVVISIKDNGNGISANLINKIFDSGYTTKTNSLGLGLSFVKKALKEKLNGTIQIKSVEGQETQVFLKLQGLCKK